MQVNTIHALNTDTLTFVLDCLPAPILLTDEQGAVRHANPPAARLLQRGPALRLAGNRLHANRQSDRKAIFTGLKTVLEKGRPELIRLCTRQDRLTLALLFHPLPEPNLSQLVLAFAGGADVQAGSDPDLLSTLFNLTPAEARVTAGISEGLHVVNIAARQGVREDTIRGHLKQVFAKTGVHSQTQLMSLVARSCNALSASSECLAMLQQPST